MCIVLLLQTSIRRSPDVKRLLFVILASVLISGLLPFLASTGAYGADGGAVFKARNCAQCHQTDGPSGDKTIGDVLKKKGPELWYAGDKFREGFLSRWLKNPSPIRPMDYYSLTRKNPGNHPRLEAGEAEAVASYLMGLKSGDMMSAGEVSPFLQKGRVVFVKRQSCYGCHQVREKGKLAGGVTGPSIEGAGVRLREDWVYSYLSNPKAFKPVRDMPDYSKYLDDSEIKGLTAYISSLK